MTRHTTDSGEVGQLYDQLSDELTEALGGNIHFGYWYDDRDQCTFQQAAEQMTDQLIQRLDPQPGQRVLDVGCGIGTPAIRLARERDARVVGISVSQRQIKQANERVRAAGLANRASFEYADAMALPYPDASFDAAWAVESMLHMPDRSQVLREIARVLRPGARLVIADFLLRQQLDAEKEALVIEFCEVSQVESIIGAADYRRLVEDAGLTPVEITDVTTYTRSSLSAMSAPLWARREVLIPVIGSELLEKIRAVTTRVDALPEIGYVLLTARKP